MLDCLHEQPEDKKTLCAEVLGHIGSVLFSGVMDPEEELDRDPGYADGSRQAAQIPANPVRRVRPSFRFSTL